jgi:methionyl aminopeptidase
LAIILKTEKDLKSMREANKVVVRVLKEMKKMAKPGMTTMDLEKKARKILLEKNAKSAFMGYRGYPAVLCTSVNEEVVHGIPSDKKKLNEGDILSIDFGAVVSGYVGDAAITLAIGEVDDEKKKLIKITRECLERAVEQMVPGNHLSDIAKAVESHAVRNNFTVVHQFVGHGIGRKMHEDPQVPNCGRPKPDSKLIKGMVLAIEPMVNAGVPDVRVSKEDGWTAVTADERPSAHFERSVAVTEDGPYILSDW